MHITYILVGVTVLVSLLALNQHQWIDKLIFWPYRMWRNNEWYRLITSGFIHSNFQLHLLFNMITLFSFGMFVEYKFGKIFGSTGPVLYVVMYILAIMLSDVYDLFKRKDDYNYRSLGASGGVSAILFASILLAPFSNILIYFAIPVPAFIFGPLYLVYCTYMAKRGGDNINHIAHFTGAVFGFVFPILLRPALFTDFISQLKAGM
ncbi:MAG: rhomboid family intrarane serine protease [Bacteroidota bacterium]|nr:rhomboid family intrarane serine protease [Bacteroidota bacterium]